MDNSQDFDRFFRPGQQQMLQALGLDQHFVRGNGSQLLDSEGRTVLDMASGFGGLPFGHNPQALVELNIAQLRSGVPMLVQGSNPPEHERLAKRLNAQLRLERGRDGSGYCVQLCSGGADAVEAAVKHAYKVKLDRITARIEGIAHQNRALVEKFAGVAAALPNGHQSLPDLCRHIEQHNQRVRDLAAGAPSLVALKGSYHGKTTATLKLTTNPVYRLDFAGLSALRPIFIPLDAPDRLADAVRGQMVELRYPHWVDGRFEVHTEQVPLVIAFIMETILGEGGVRPVPYATLQRLAELRGQLGIPFIIDEVQTGFGRGGRVFDFTQTPLAAIEPDYLLLGKALGGGISKLGATLFRRDLYQPEFGLLHSSTFAEDPASTQIALATLEMLTADEGALLRESRRLGAYLMDRLSGLQAHFPGVVRELRGRGLMLGMELQTPTAAGAPLRTAGYRGALALLAVSYLMHHHAIRLIAPLQTLLPSRTRGPRPSVLRIQPPATLTHAEAEHFIDALADTLDRMQRNDEQRLFGHLGEAAMSAFEQAGLDQVAPVVPSAASASRQAQRQGSEGCRQ